MLSAALVSMLLSADPEPPPVAARRDISIANTTTSEAIVVLEILPGLDSGKDTVVDRERMKKGARVTKRAAFYCEEGWSVEWRLSVLSLGVPHKMGDFLPCKPGHNLAIEWHLDEAFLEMAATATWVPRKKN